MVIRVPANEHNGINNAIVGLEFAYGFGQSFSLVGYSAYSQAINRKRGELLDNEGWAGLGIFYQY